MHPSANVTPRPPAEALIVAGRACAVAMVALLAAPLCVESQTPADGVPCHGIEVVSAELSHKEAEQYCQYAARERQKVEKYWGPTWRDPIRIQVSSQYAAANTLVQTGGKPGRIDIPLDRVRDRTGALLHEITHNYAFSENRFLYEGLGVYLQDKMGEARSFPTFGRPLDAAAAEVARNVGSLDALNAVRFPRPLASVMPDRAAYLLAGSFVKYLMDRKGGLDKFRAVYASGDYQATYGVPFSALEGDWRAHLPRR
jgi:hypothetical protein